jgi:hypothetical protein
MSSRELLDEIYVYWDRGESAPEALVGEANRRGWEDLNFLKTQRSFSAREAMSDGLRGM